MHKDCVFYADQKSMITNAIPQALVARTYHPL